VISRLVDISDIFVIQVCLQGNEKDSEPVPKQAWQEHKFTNSIRNCYNNH